MNLPELHALTRDIAAVPDSWRPHITHDPEQRTFYRVLDGEDVTVWLICWSPGHDTGFHDHDGSWGAVRVLEGEIREERPTPSGIPHARVLRPGETFEFEPSVIHRVLHSGRTPTVTLHAYSPPLRTMGAYSVTPDGVLLREVLGESDELKPLTTG